VPGLGQFHADGGSDAAHGASHESDALRHFLSFLAEGVSKNGRTAAFLPTNVTEDFLQRVGPPSRPVDN